MINTRSVRRRIVAVLLMVGLVAGWTLLPDRERAAVAAPLTGSTWCAYKDSLALLGGSSGTGYLTAGYNNPDQTYQPTTYGWWTRVSAFAASSWGARADNYSRNGASASSFLPSGQWAVTRDAVADMTVKQPDLALIALGTNEYLAQLPPEQFEANLRELVERIQTATPRTAIMLIVQFTAYKAAPVTHNWEAYKQRIQAVAIERRTAMVDLRQYIPPATGSDWAKFFHPDRIHLLDHAHLIYAGAIQTWLFSC